MTYLQPAHQTPSPTWPGGSGPVKHLTGAYTVTPADNGCLIVNDTASAAIVITIPTGLPETFVIGFAQVNPADSTWTLQATLSGSEALIGPLASTGQHLKTGNMGGAFWLQRFSTADLGWLVAHQIGNVGNPF